VTRRRLFALVLAAAAAGCTAGPALPSPTASPRPIGGLDASGTPLPTVAPGSLPGRIVAVRGEELVVLERGKSTTIARSPPGGAIRTPAWSPDGQSVAYAYTPPRGTPRAGRPSPDDLPTTDILVVGADGTGGRVAVAHEGPGGQADSPTWTPDGRALVYAYYRATYNGEQFVGETTQVRRTDLASGATTTLASSASSPTLSADGRQLAYLHDDASTGLSIRTTTIGGAGELQLTQPGEFAQIQAPALSPDGATVAFAGSKLPKAGGPTPPGLVRDLLRPRTASAHGYPWEAWSVPASGGTARQITSIGEDSPFVRWSSDGARLLVLGGGGLYLVDSHTGATSFVDPEGSHGGFDWRSNG
jgi:Tol biopolymer transport system component